MKINKKTIHDVDQVIMETGCYQAIELLLRSDQLAYGDYEQWRMGHIAYLSDILEPQADSIIDYLDEALAYVKSLKMIPQSMEMIQWQQSETIHTLKFCPDDSIFSNSLSSYYIIANSHDQMDLFFDNQSLTIVNGLKQALISRNIRRASEKLQALYSIEPQHELYEPARTLLDTLVNALEEDQINEPVQEMSFLLQTLRPMARKVLSGLERDYMAFFWHRLARQIDDSLYDDNDDEKMHSSFCYEQIPDWQAVLQAIENNQTEKSPKLYARFILALNKSGRQQEYMQSICQFCWQFPEQEPEQIISIDASLKKIWYAFLDFDAEQEVDKQWGSEHFPAWLLINDPGVCQYIVSDYVSSETNSSNANSSDSNSLEAFTVLQKLILAELQDEAQAIELRKQLMAIHAGILGAYLQTSQVL